MGKFTALPALLWLGVGCVLKVRLKFSVPVLTFLVFWSFSEALTLDLFEGCQQEKNPAGKKREGCASADSILDGHDGDELDASFQLDALLAKSCPHLSHRPLVSSATQTEETTTSQKKRAPQIGTTRYANKRNWCCSANKTTNLSGGNLVTNVLVFCHENYCGPGVFKNWRFFIKRCADIEVAHQNCRKWEKLFSGTTEQCLVFCHKKIFLSEGLGFQLTSQNVKRER